MIQRHVLLLGDYQAQEFEPAVAWLRAHTILHLASSVDDAVRWLVEGGADHCQAIVFAQQRRGPISAAAIEQLHVAAPLARLIALLGSWLEGDLRAHAALSGVIRVYWHQFCARATREWLSPGEDAGTWSQSRMVVDSEPVLQNQPSIASAHNGLAVIHAGSLMAYECLSEVCRLRGWATVWLAPSQTVHVERAAVLLWDVPGAVESDEPQWRAWHDRLQPSSSIVVLGFPRPHDIQRLLQAGASAVLAKPLMIADLLTVLDQTASVSDATFRVAERRAG